VVEYLHRLPRPRHGSLINAGAWPALHRVDPPTRRRRRAARGRVQLSDVEASRRWRKVLCLDVLVVENDPGRL